MAAKVSAACRTSPSRTFSSNCRRSGGWARSATCSDAARHGQMKDAISQIDDKDLDRTAAIIRSMTPAERENPKMINGSRRLRIANGSGVRGQRRQHARGPLLRGAQADGADARLGWAAAGGMQRRSGKNARNNKKGKKGRQAGRGPTQARTPAGLPPGALAGLGGLGGGGLGAGGGGGPSAPGWVTAAHRSYQPGMKCPT